MDKKQLEHLNCTKAEIRFLTAEIEHWPEGIVTDYYYDYPNGQKRVRPLIGYADCSGLKRLLDEKLKTLQTEIEQMEQYLDTIDDTEIRAILRLRYRNGLTLQQIGDELGYELSTVSKKITAFWKESNNSNK
jgi:DNA-directed RNA polymerase specialized sigma24 family protein